LRPHKIARKGIARTFQLTALFNQLRVIDNLLIGFHQLAAGGFWSSILHTPTWKSDKKEAEAKVAQIVQFLGLEKRTFEQVSTLSQGEQRLLSIGIALMSSPKMILLDEPTGGLIQEDTDVITRLIRKVNETGVTVCLIEHKMRMVMDLAERIIVLNYGSKIAEGKPGEIAADPKVIEAYLGRKRNA
jgi:ABC-type branched-subunit amino acid transport system ATPase component